MSGNHNAISKFPRAKYTASSVDHRKCEKKPKSYYAMNPFMFFDFTGPTAFWALGESKLCQQTKTQLKMTNMPPILMIFQILLARAWIFQILPASSWTFKILPTLNLPYLAVWNRAGKILKFLNLEILQILLTRSKTQTMDSVRWISCNTPLRH